MKTDVRIIVTDVRIIVSPFCAGYAGGSSHLHKGAAVDYLCLPRDPIWGSHKNTNVLYGGFVFGAEYEFPHTSGFHDQDVPCAVCLTITHSTSLMIPGRRDCYPGWTQAYQGDLSGGYHDHNAASQYVCLDENIQSLNDTAANKIGKLFYFVKARCGSLPCPPYEEGKHLACAVCLK